MKVVRLDLDLYEREHRLQSSFQKDRKKKKKKKKPPRQKECVCVCVCAQRRPISKAAGEREQDTKPTENKTKKQALNGGTIAFPTMVSESGKLESTMMHAAHNGLAKCSFV